jgi:hypothetical protein
VLTHAKSIDNTTDNHLRQMPGHDLEDGANGIADKPKSDGLLAAELVAKGEGEDGTAEGTELSRVNMDFNSGVLGTEVAYRETTRGDARNVGLLGLRKPILEVGRDQHAREDALVVAEP